MYSEFRMPNHNSKHTRKNNKQSKPVDPPKMDPSVTVVDDDDDGFGSILSKIAPRNTTRSNKKKNTPPQPPPPAPVPEWEQVGMTQEDYEALRQRIAKEMMDSQIESYKQAMLDDLDSISFWEGRIETLERSRERYNKKRGWSADDIAAVEEIDAEINECENEIASIESLDDFDDTECGVLVY